MAMNSTTFEKITTYYGYTYFIPSICLFGIVCNLINLSVLTNSKLRESPYTYLTGLAVSDILTLLSSFTITFTRGNWFDSYKSVTVNYWFKLFERKFFLPTANIFSAFSVIITVALTLERYVFIKMPMKASAFCSPKFARKIILALFVLVTMFRLPMFFFWSIDLVEIKSNLTEPLIAHHNKSDVYMQIKSVRNYEDFQKFYFLVSFFIFEIIPFLILLFLNINLIMLVKKSNKEFLFLRNNSSEMHEIKQMKDNLNFDREMKTINSTSLNIQEQIKENNSSETAETVQFGFKSLRQRQTRSIVHRPTLTRRKRDEIKLTRTLISLIFLALLSEISSIITYDKITEFLIAKHFKNYMETTYKLQVFVSNMIILTLHSFNFFLFCAFNKKYNSSLRQQYSRYLSKCLCKFKLEDHQFN